MSATPLCDLVDARFTRITLGRPRIEADVEVVTVEAGQLVDLCRFLTTDADAAYDLVDLSAIDHGPEARSRFTLFIAIVSRTHQSRARLEVALANDDTPFPSLAGLWPAALVYERELIDFFGLVAEGHPQPQRLLLPDGYVGHPLRVDHRVGKYQPQVPPPSTTPERLGGAS